MLRWVCLCSFLIALAGCTQTQPPSIAELECISLVTCDHSVEESAGTLSVTELRQQLNDLDGQRILVRGRISYCRGNTCSICELQTEEGPCVSIGEDTAFDQTVSVFLGSEILIEATVDTSCFRPELICLDRVPTLAEPTFLGTLS